MSQFNSDYSHLSPHKRFLARLRDTVVSRLGGVTRAHHEYVLARLSERDHRQIQMYLASLDERDALADKLGKEIEFLRAELEQAVADETRYKLAYNGTLTQLRAMEEDWEKEFYERREAEKKCRELQARIDSAKKVLAESLKRDRLTGEE